MIEIPDLHEATLDRELCEKLFQDIVGHCRVFEIRLKEHPERMVRPTGTISVFDAYELLSTGKIRGVQITYGHQGQEWRDTVIGSADCFRLVRIKLN